MEVDSPHPPDSGGRTNGLNGLVKSGALTANSTAKVSDLIGLFRPTKVSAVSCLAQTLQPLTLIRLKLFKRDKHDKPTSILSLDFNDDGSLLMTSESDESMQIYSVKDGAHSKTCLSKKYGVKHAKFAHAEGCVIHASTKENGQYIISSFCHL